MSIDRCSVCGNSVDTDTDTECYELGNQGSVLCTCKRCRDIHAPDTVLDYLLSRDRDGAVLVWQVPDHLRLQFANAERDGTILYDAKHDLYVHPLATPLGDGSYSIARPFRAVRGYVEGPGLTQPCPVDDLPDVDGFVDLLNDVFEAGRNS